MEIRKQVVLLVDNRTSYLNVQTSLLEDVGYQVLNANSTEDANQLLQEKHVHLIISDIRMEDDDDPEDISGLLWVQGESYRPIPKIILTAYPEDYVRQVLEVVLVKQANIVGFVSKPSEPKKLHEEISQAFTDKVKINRELIIRWNQAYSPNRLLSLVEQQITPLQLEERLKEFEDLLRRLFYDFVQVTLGRIITTTLSHVIFEAFAYDQIGKEKQYIISCGQRDIIVNEDKRNKAMPTGKGLGSTRWANELSLVETMRFAASGYHLVEGDLEDMTSFATYYQHHEVQKSIIALEHLYHTTLASWYEGGISYQEHHLFDLVQSTPYSDPVHEKAWGSKIKALCEQSLVAGIARFTVENQRLFFHPANHPPVSHPLPTYHFLTALPKQQLLRGTIHGRIDGHSVRVDREGKTWLINFSEVGSGVILRDFALLETHIKFDWLRSLSVADRYVLEQRLLVMEHLEATNDINDLLPNTVKAKQIITRLRQLAADYLSSGLHSYFFGLCAYTVSYLNSFNPTIRYKRSELQTFAHALLSIAMLSEFLAMPDGNNIHHMLPPQAYRGLWIDERNKTVWLKGQEIGLTPREYALLAYLYQNSNQLCTREAIEPIVWGDDAVLLISKSALDTLIGRLRKKIESDPQDPQYIITVRGQGYKLVI